MPNQKRVNHLILYKPAKVPIIAIDPIIDARLITMSWYFVNRNRAIVMESKPEIFMTSLIDLLNFINPGKISQNEEIVKQSTTIPPNAIGLPELGFPLIAF